MDPLLFGIFILLISALAVGMIILMLWIVWPDLPEYVWPKIIWPAIKKNPLQPLFMLKNAMGPKTILFIGGLLVVLRLIFPVMTLEVKPVIRDTPFTIVAHFYPLIGCEDYGEKCYNTRLNDTRTNMQAIAIGVATIVLMVLVRKRRSNH